MLTPLFERACTIAERLLLPAEKRALDDWLKRARLSSFRYNVRAHVDESGDIVVDVHGRVQKFANVESLPPPYSIFYTQIPVRDVRSTTESDDRT